MKRGDVIARGNRILDQNGQTAGCDVDFGIQTPKFSAGRYSITLRRDDNCIISIDEVDESQTGPQLQARSSPWLPPALARLVDRVIDFIEPRLSADYGPKRTTNYVWTYGYGGTWDDLTEVRGFLDFTWTGSYATWQSAYSYCDPHWQTYWYAGICYNIFWQTSGGWVEQLTQGDFYWSPPGCDHCYQHSLRNDRQGDQYGNGSCSGYISGSIPNAATMICYVTQPPPCGVGGQCFSSPPHDQGS